VRLLFYGGVMSLQGNIEVEVAMQELLDFYEEWSDLEQDRYETQLMMLVDKIRSIKNQAENGLY
jgi:hypothetical protein